MHEGPRHHKEQRRRNESANSERLDDYLPQPEQVARANLLKRLARQLEASGAQYAVTGGYGLDGLYGRLTRDHDDIDITTTEEDLPRVQKIVRAAGFDIDIVKIRGNVEVYIHPPTDTKLELATTDKLKEYTDISPEQIIPGMANASLDGVAFRTPTVAGHEEITRIQTRRAEEGQWGPYAHTEWKERIMAAIKKVRDAQ